MGELGAGLFVALGSPLTLLTAPQLLLLPCEILSSCTAAVLMANSVLSDRVMKPRSVNSQLSALED